MKILFVSTANISALGGDVRSLIGFSQSFKDSFDCDISLLAPRSDENELDIYFDEIIPSTKKFNFGPRMWNSLLFNIFRFEHDANFDEYDLIICFHAHAFAWFRLQSIPRHKVLINCEVLESLVWGELTNKPFFTKAWIKSLPSVECIRKDEVKTFNSVHSVFTYSERELGLLKQEVSTRIKQVFFPYVTCLNANSVKSSSPVHKQKCFKDSLIRIGFIGNLSWNPNKESFNLLKRLVKYNSNIVVYRVGDPERNSGNVSNLINLGRVKDLKSDFYEVVDLVWAVVPANGGVRVKIVEALCHGVPVISNEKSLEGIPQRLRAGVVYFDSDMEALLQSLSNFVMDPSIQRQSVELFSSKHLEQTLLEIL